MYTTNISNINNSFAVSFRQLWEGIIYFLPAIIIALAILILGIIFASILGKLVTKITGKLYVDKVLTGEIKSKLKELNINLTISGALGWSVKWFIIIGTLLVVSDILKLGTISEFLIKVLLYIPNIIVATVIVVIGLVVAGFVSELVEKSVAGSKLVSSSAPIVLKNITKWLIILFSVMTALSQIKIAPQIIQTLFTGIIFSVSLASGLAFGFGGKKKAEELLDVLFGNKN